jgi:hypothetical protein
MKSNPVSDHPANNDRANDNPDKRRRINLSADSSQDNLNPENVNRDKAKADNLSRASKLANGDNRVNSRKMDSVSRANADSAARRACRTTINRAAHARLKGARTASSRRSPAKIS